MLILIGALPPPVHGMSSVNKYMLDLFDARSPNVRKINIAAPGLERRLSQRILRVARVIVGTVRFLMLLRPSQTTVYLSISGGFGQIYEVLFICLARLFHAQLYLHHHSFAYLDTHSGLTRLLCRCAGASATHITLSPKMSSMLGSNYGVKNVLALSNTAFLDEDMHGSSSSKLKLSHIGFLSNISEEKGIFHFLSLCRAVHERQLPILALIAGPFQDHATEIQVMQELASLPTVRYIGPVYGSEKSEFFNNIDVLIFPTIYFNEAEPLTIYEALSCHAPVIAYDRGAIGEVLSPKVGLAIPRAQDFTNQALPLLERWLEYPEEFHAASMNARLRFVSLRDENKKKLDALLASIIPAVSS